MRWRCRSTITYLYIINIIKLQFQWMCKFLYWLLKGRRNINIPLWELHFDYSIRFDGSSFVITLEYSGATQFAEIISNRRLPLMWDADEYKENDHSSAVVCLIQYNTTLWEEFDLKWPYLPSLCRPVYKYEDHHWNEYLPTPTSSMYNNRISHNSAHRS